MPLICEQAVRRGAVSSGGRSDTRARVALASVVLLAALLHLGSRIEVSP